MYDNNTCQDIGKKKPLNIAMIRKRQCIQIHTYNIICDLFNVFAERHVCMYMYDTYVYIVMYMCRIAISTRDSMFNSITFTYAVY